MTRLVDVPTQFDDRSFDQFSSAFAEATRDGERLLFDAHAAEWASPYGLVGLLVAGEAARQRSGGEPALLAAPQVMKAFRYDPKAPENTAYYATSLSTKIVYATFYLGLAGYLAVMSYDVHNMLGAG